MTNTYPPAPMPLESILNGLPFLVSRSAIPPAVITGISIDSRNVKSGNLFIARRGSTYDGHRFISSAVERGAAAVVGEDPVSGLGVPYIQVTNTNQAVTWLAAAFYGWPGKKLTVIGVTGTDGKTTTSNLLYHILINAGIKVGLISTVNAVIGDSIVDTGFHVTTPDAPDLQDYLARMVSAGLTHVILETTSHGLAQHRVDASQYDIAVVTNITHEHLDQHGSYEQYLAAKGRLFTLLGVTSLKPNGNPRLSVLNRNDSSFDYLARLAPGPSVSYGMHVPADVTASEVKYTPHGIQFTVVGREFKAAVACQLVGEFNIMNCLAAMATAVYGLGIDPEIAATGIGRLNGIPGRMERIDMGQSFTAIVDFAHTPNALRVAIETLRKMSNRKVIVIVGSAGLRDRQKRRMMAEISTRLSDISIFTAEDPRTESLQEILNEMRQGAQAVGGREAEDFYIETDRGDAIREGVRMAQDGDIVVSFGKGHEQSMCFGEVEYPWDDRIAMRSALAELLQIPGPQMPYLPTSDKGFSNG